MKVEVYSVLGVECAPLCRGVLRTYPHVTEFIGKGRYQAAISNTTSTLSFLSGVKGTEQEAVNSLHSRIREIMFPCPTYVMSD